MAKTENRKSSPGRSKTENRKPGRRELLVQFIHCGELGTARAARPRGTRGGCLRALPKTALVPMPIFLFRHFDPGSASERQNFDGCGGGVSHLPSGSTELGVDLPVVNINRKSGNVDPEIEIV